MPDTPLQIPKANILIVDDQEAKRLGLAAALSPLDQNVVLATSGREALRLLLAGDFAVILLDVRMPGMDGFETAELIRSRRQTETTPIIFVTAHDRAEADMLGGYDIGAVDFIFSPVRPEVLRAKVSVFVDLHLKTLTVQAHERRLRELEAREARARQEELRRENERERRSARFELFKLSSAIEQTADPILITSAEGVIEYVNSAFEEITGYGREEALGQNPALLNSGLHGPEVFEAMWSTLLRGEVYRGELINRRKDGTLYHEEKTITPIKGESGEITHFVSTGKDVTYRRQMEEELRALNTSLEARVQERTAQLEDVNGELEAYAYSISHDLRTPLRHIASFADLLSRHTQGALSPSSARHLQLIQDGARRMEHLIDGLLDFARTGRHDLSPQTVALGTLVREVIRDLDNAPGSREVQWQVRELPTVQADVMALRQILTNLLSNAVKYSQGQDEPHIEIWSECSDHEDVVHVRDNGVGFNMAYSHKLFGVFQRLHAAEAFEGYGVGLANVRRMVMRHGGRVWAQGQEGQGATFSFSLPRHETPGEPVSTQARPC
ncbi:ATP-binding protein [Deinococcus hohokamensis]|uniref:histidine kinase n=1 Tax=Deinococcus hohokamensis TaxID=309883 RepID=A0ABV9I7Q8_9DEIO